MKKVFLSHASDDPEWPEDEIEKIARGFDELGTYVYLDFRHKNNTRPSPSPSDWLEWMKDGINNSDHVLCLVSKKYELLWQRDPELKAGYGVAFEAIRLIKNLYFKKGRNNGFIVTLKRDESPREVIPDDLGFDTPNYLWPKESCDVISALSGAKKVSNDRIAQQLQSQIDQCVESLKKSQEFLRAIVESGNFKDWCQSFLDESSLQNISEFCNEFAHWVHCLEIEKIKDVMIELNRCYGEAIRWCENSESRDRAGTAVVSVYLLCACRLINVQVGGQAILVPAENDDEDSALLMASIIHATLGGGALKVVSANKQGVPKLEGAYKASNLAGLSPDDEFERALHHDYNVKFDSTVNSQKVGKLETKERDDLIVELEDLQGVGKNKIPLTFLVSTAGKDLTGHEFRFAKLLSVPVFHIRKDSTSTVHQNSNMTEQQLLIRIRNLWNRVEENRDKKSETSDLPSANVSLKDDDGRHLDFLQIIRALAESRPDVLQLKELHERISVLEKEKSEGKQSSKEYIETTQKAAEAVKTVLDSSEKVVGLGTVVYKFIGSFF